MMVTIEEVRKFWDANPCGAKLSELKDRKCWFEEIEARRYQLVPHILDIARFSEFRGRDVLEIGCGVGTDGMQFARNGARYVATDLAPQSVAITQERFRLFGVDGRFQVANAESLPFPDESFDHVYSFGVIHHSPDTEAIVEEIYRVLRPSGTFCVMVYNRTSINYHVEIMFLRKALRLLLYPAFAPRVVSRVTGFEEWKLAAHREVMLKKKKLTKQEWISMNTDGPNCPLAKVYDARDVLTLFSGFEDVRTEVWHFDRSHWPIIGEIIPNSVARFLGRHWGWHRIVYGRKPLSCPPITAKGPR